MTLPPLDCHAHISVDATPRQISALSPSLIFAMTRDLDEAFDASKRCDTDILWGVGMHPSAAALATDFDVERFKTRAKNSSLVGEVGMDRKSGNLNQQQQIFAEILTAVKDQPLLVSIHSTGCVEEVIRSIATSGNRHGLIMHWFTGTPEQALDLLGHGCYFSVNSAMSDSLLAKMPIDRLLPETDFPVARKRTGKQPGDTAQIEATLARLHKTDPSKIRSQFYKNLRRISVESGALDRMPKGLSEMLLVAT